MRFDGKYSLYFSVDASINQSKSTIMKKISLLLFVLMTTILLSSFTYSNNTGFIGTYGVTSVNSSKVNLTINSDNTFYFQDFSDSENKITAQGTWELKGKKVILEDLTLQNKFHDVWTFDETGNVAHSRKGLCFYRLCKITI